MEQSEPVWVPGGIASSSSGNLFQDKKKSLGKTRKNEYDDNITSSNKNLKIISTNESSKNLNNFSSFGG